MDLHTRLLLKNRAWAAETKRNNPGFFDRIAEQQQPNFLWIGCSDSRVPSNVITNSDPGEIFVHRNIAALVVSGDPSLLGVLHYAVSVLKVRDIIVCGHYRCGGIRASLGKVDHPILDSWLGNIRAVYEANVEKFNKESDPQIREAMLVEEVVRQQVRNLASTETVRNAWNAQQPLSLHGWVAGLSDGILHELISITGRDSEEVFPSPPRNGERQKKSSEPTLDTQAP